MLLTGVIVGLRMTDHIKLLNLEILFQLLLHFSINLVEYNLGIALFWCKK